MSFLYPDIIAPGQNGPIVTPTSPEGIERRRWERPRNQFENGIPGMNRVGHEEYPKALHKAGRVNGTRVDVTESKTVRSEEEERIAVGQGWAKTPDAAVQAFHDAYNETAKVAANRAWHDQRMSEPARREAERIERTTDGLAQLGEIPAQPLKPRGRPRKVVATE